MNRPDGTSDNSVAIEWLCKYCKNWNGWFKRYCTVCLAQKSYAKEAER